MNGHKLIQWDGIPGAGKSTLIELVAERLRQLGHKVVIAKEPLEKWVDKTTEGSPRNGQSLLEMFYKDPKRWGYLFQTRVFVDRVDQIREVFSNLSEPTIILAERGLTSDMFFMNTLFKSGNLEYIEHVSYLQLWQKWIELVPIRPFVGIYLKPSLEHVELRIKNRNRSGEEGIPLSYLQALELEHDQFYSTEDYFPKVVLSSEHVDADFRDPQFFNKIFEFVEKVILN